MHARLGRVRLFVLVDDGDSGVFGETAEKVRRVLYQHPQDPNDSPAWIHLHSMVALYTIKCAHKITCL